MNRIKPSGPITASFVLAALAAQACGSTDGPEKTEAPATSGTAVSANVKLASGVRLSSQLAADLERGGPSIGVQIHLADAPLPEDDEVDVGSATLEHGEVIAGTLNDQPATARDFADYAAAQQRRLAGRLETKRAWRSQQWQELGRRYGISQELAYAAENGLTSVAVDVAPAVARSLASGQGGLVRALDRRVQGTASLTSALASLELSTLAFPAGWKGDGLGIFLTDFGNLDSNKACVNKSKLTIASGTSSTIEDHATLMTCLLQAAAPGAHVLYRTVSGECGSEIPSQALNHDPPIYVSSQSDNWFGDRKYWFCDGDFDNRVLDTRVAHFNSVGNWASDKAVFSPAVAYNVISVGGFNDESNPDSMWAGSNYVDPLTGVSKPEFVGPAGDNIDVGDSYKATGGTSVATPLVAGFATDLMEQASFLRGRPQVLKAFMVANAVRISDDNGLVTGDKDGAGRPDYSNVQGGDSATGGWSYWWSGSNGSFFTKDSDGDGRKEIHVTRTLAKGTYHVAANWLVSGTYVETHGKPNMDIDLLIQNASGTLLASSDSEEQTLEATKLTLTATTDVTFILERYWNSGTGPVALGLVIRKR